MQNSLFINFDSISMKTPGNSKKNFLIISFAPISILIFSNISYQIHIKRTYPRHNTLQNAFPTYPHILLLLSPLVL